MMTDSGFYVAFSDTAAQDEEVLRGVVFDYGETGEQKGWFAKRRWRIDPGAIALAFPVIVNLGHDSDKPVAGSGGRYVTLHDEKDRLWMSLIYPDTHFGRLAREGVRSGVYTGLSGELDMTKVTQHDDLSIVNSAVLDGVALVSRPAFAGSRYFSAQATQYATFDDAILRFADVLSGLIRWGQIGVTSAANKKAVVFEKDSLTIPPNVVFTLGSSYDNIMASVKNGGLTLRATEDGIAWVLKKTADTPAAQTLHALIRDKLITGFSVGFQRRASEITKELIDGVVYDVERVSDAVICELRSNSSGMGGMGPVKAGRPTRRIRRWRRR